MAISDVTGYAAAERPVDMTINPRTVLEFEHLAASLAHAGKDGAPVVQLGIIGVGKGVGGSTIAFNLARTLAASGEKTLLIRVVAGQAKGGEIDSAHALLSQTREEVRNFYTLTLVADTLPLKSLKTEDAFADILAGLAERFSRIVWDVPPAGTLPEARALCRALEGTVLVLHAGQTRWHAARYAADYLESAGVRLLGVVLNKKKAYIPEWIYRLFFRSRS